MEPHAGNVLEVQVTQDSVDQPTARRGRRWLVALAVVVALALGAAGGVLVGQQTAPAPTAATGDGPVVEESPEAEPLPVGLPPSSATPMPTVPVSLLVAADANGGTAVVMTAGEGLSNTITSATGYRIVNDGISPGQVAAVLGEALGVAGVPEQTAQGWVAGPLAGRHLVVREDPLVTWEIVDGAVAEPADSTGAPDEPAGGTASADATGDATDGSTGDAQEQPAEATPSATEPSASDSTGTGTAAASPSVAPTITADRAIELATTLLSGIGVDVASVDWQVDRLADLTRVTAWQTVDRARTSLSWELGFAPDGEIVTARGFSAGLHQVPDYPVVGARAAVERTGDADWRALVPRLISAGAPSLDAGDAVGVDESPVPAPASTDDPAALPSLPEDTFENTPEPTPTSAAMPSASASAAPAPSPSPRPSILVAVTNVTAESAELGIAQYWQADGSLLILPAYVVTATDGSRWSVLAVAADYVDFVDAPPVAAAS